MGQKLYKMIDLGACAYFLILYSVMSFVIETWSTSGAGFIMSAAASLLMLSAGLVLLKKYKNELLEDSEEISRTAGLASRMIGGSTILIIMIQLLLRILLMTIKNFSSDSLTFRLFFNLNSLVWNMIFHLVIFAFAAAAAISLRKGLKRIKDQPYAAELRFVCYRTALIYLFFRGIFYMLQWLRPLLMMQDYRIITSDLYWNIVPLVSVAAALILYFVPLKINTGIRTVNPQTHQALTGWSQIIGGRLLLLTGVFELTEQLILVVMQLFSAFGGNVSENPYPALTLSLAPTLVLILIGILIIKYGKKFARAMNAEEKEDQSIDLK